MRILCGYSEVMIDLVPDIKEADPKVILAGHDVVVANSYGDVMFEMTNTSVRLPTFDIVLLDTVLPWSLNSTERMPTVLLSQYVNVGLILGIGYFVPTFFDSEFNFHDDNHCYATVADRTCWTWNHERDWIKLLGLVNERIEGGG